MTNSFSALVRASYERSGHSIADDFYVQHQSRIPDYHPSEVCSLSDLILQDSMLISAVDDVHSLSSLATHQPRRRNSRYLAADMDNEPVLNADGTVSDPVVCPSPHWVPSRNTGRGRGFDTRRSSTSGTNTPVGYTSPEPSPGTPPPIQPRGTITTQQIRPTPPPRINSGDSNRSRRPVVSSLPTMRRRVPSNHLVAVSLDTGMMRRNDPLNQPFCIDNGYDR
eukprot:NODE_5546_length_999_cov_51.555936_g4973_i0.p1 GENE.NODE_5546_length_999_cov_51.555936_g4973_i0~~NODE_5546_length_999_cov_51.555936_g4973_i0.p1  ORF type:complete len:223 (-),score=57.22 NODE_5546_length_999_cov_51.555936_g4973_i0:245-913(-)